MKLIKKINFNNKIIKIEKQIFTNLIYLEEKEFSSKIKNFVFKNKKFLKTNFFKKRFKSWSSDYSSLKNLEEIKFLLNSLDK